MIILNLFSDGKLLYYNILAEFDLMDIQVRNYINFRSLPYYMTGITCVRQGYILIVRYVSSLDYSANILCQC
jgi:hypothetical protein